MDPRQSAEDFFSKLPSEEEAHGKEFKFFEETKPETPETPENPGTPETPEQPEGERKRPIDRSERREQRQTNWLTQQIQEEREARIRLEEQLKMLSQTKDVPVDPDIKRLLTEAKDPEEATQIFNAVMERMEERALARAEARYRELSEEDEAEITSQADEISEAIEEIEDEYGVNLERGSEERSNFIDFLEHIAPKNSNELPDIGAAWEVYSQLNKPRGSNVAEKQQISSRSMTKSTLANSRPPQSELKPVNFDNIRDLIRSKFGGGE